MTSSHHAPGIEQLEPAAVWRLFADMAAIPRPSKHEERIRAHVRQVAAGLGFKTREDRVGNLLIEVPAKPGCEKAPITVLQGHLDMVCEKNSGTPHDFDRDPIRLIIDRDAAGEPIVRAAGTTLGADNGIGVAMALAAAGSPDVKHGPLEILCTIDEEMGMTGAGHLEAGFLRGKHMLNLDSEEDHVLYIGCAGGGDIVLTFEFARGPLAAPGEAARVAVGGLRGGHSGGDIHENRGNAIKTLVRTLLGAGVNGLQLASISGGSKRNAIPREAAALLAGPAGTLAALQQAAAAVRDAVARESAEPNAVINVEPLARDALGPVLSAADSRRLLDVLTAMPHGVLEMHAKMKGLVQTSNNTATVVSEAAADGAKLKVVIGALSRSSVEGRLAATREQIAAIGRLAGAAVELGHSYPGWDPNLDSPLLKTCQRVYGRLFGQEPTVTAIHAGLECGIIGRRYPGLDMISFGPRIQGAHSPDERVFVRSVQKSYQFLTAVLGELAKG